MFRMRQVTQEAESITLTPAGQIDNSKLCHSPLALGSRVQVRVYLMLVPPRCALRELDRLRTSPPPSLIDRRRQRAVFAHTSVRRDRLGSNSSGGTGGATEGCGASVLRQCIFRRFHDFLCEQIEQRANAQAILGGLEAATCLEACTALHYNAPHGITAHHSPAGRSFRSLTAG